MIAFHAQGGLGNQLFQYAAARRLALLHGVELVVDPYWFDNYRPGETPRSIELKKFAVNMRIASFVEQRQWSPYRSRFGPFLQRFFPLELCRESGDRINADVLNAKNNSYLHGFWQSYLYFQDIRPTLLKEFVPVIEPSKTDQEVASLISQSNAVSVHVRRGDYVTLQSASAYHGTCSLDYYRAALKYMTERLVNPVFFVFSDDPIWTSENLHFDHAAHYIRHNSTDTAFQDLRLMSKCHHHIIANSSFSWWGAWLSDKRDSVVIAPDKWFAGGRSAPDLLPTDWIRV